MAERTPADFADITWDELLPLYHELVERPLSRATVEVWLSDWSRRIFRSAIELPSPNSRSNTTCGLFCIGRGDVGLCQEIVSRYEQLRPSPQFKLVPSIISSSDGRGVSCPMWRAAI